MPNFRFVGNGDNDPAELVFGGITFIKGKATAVPDDFPYLGKLRGNSHFEAVKGRPRKNDKDES